MTPEEQSNKERYQVKIERAENGYLVRAGKGFWVFSDLASAFKHIEDFFRNNPMHPVSAPTWGGAAMTATENGNMCAFGFDSKTEGACWGLSKREYLAGLAMQGFVASYTDSWPDKW